MIILLGLFDCWGRIVKNTTDWRVDAESRLDWYEYFYFSIVTAATPGYAGYTPASGLYTLIAGAEAIFGTFMWAAFIATFARKWQR